MKLRGEGHVAPQKHLSLAMATGRRIEGLLQVPEARPKEAPNVQKKRASDAPQLQARVRPAGKHKHGEDNRVRWRNEEWWR